MSELGPSFCFLVGGEAGEKGLSGEAFAFGGRTGEDEEVSIFDGSRLSEKSFGGEL